MAETTGVASDADGVPARPARSFLARPQPTTGAVRVGGDSFHPMPPHAGAHHHFISNSSPCYLSSRMLSSLLIKHAYVALDRCMRVVTKFDNPPPPTTYTSSFHRICM